MNFIDSKPFAKNTIHLMRYWPLEKGIRMNVIKAIFDFVRSKPQLIGAAVSSAVGIAGSIIGNKLMMKLAESAAEATAHNEELKAYTYPTNEEKAENEEESVIE